MLVAVAVVVVSAVAVVDVIAMQCGGRSTTTHVLLMRSYHKCCGAKNDNQTVCIQAQSERTSTHI